MKKVMLIFVIGILVFGTNVFAAGDLEVNGLLGVGTPPYAGSKVSISATNIGRAMEAGMTTDNGGYSSIGMDIGSVRTGSNELTNDVATFASNVNLADTGDRTISGFVAAVRNNIRYLSTTAGTSAVTSSIYTNAYYSFQKHSTNTRDFNVNTQAANVIAAGHLDNGTSSAVNYDDFRNLWIKSSTFVQSSATTLAGIWIDPLTANGGTSYGIVLDGNGTGSDIAFGPNQEASIYSKQETVPDSSYVGLWVKDGGGNETQISPHDPETGEWVFYSRNINTGRTVRVNMEKLIKAVEKLTGETFMVETLMEE